MDNSLAIILSSWSIDAITFITALIIQFSGYYTEANQNEATSCRYSKHVRQLKSCSKTERIHITVNIEQSWLYNEGGTCLPLEAFLYFWARFEFWFYNCENLVFFISFSFWLALFIHSIFPVYLSNTFDLDLPALPSLSLSDYQVNELQYALTWM